MGAGDTAPDRGVPGPLAESAAARESRKRWLTRGLGSASTGGAVALIALIVSGVSLYLADRSQSTQEREAKLTELRGGYNHIAALESQHRTPAQGGELDAEIAIAATLMRELGRNATSGDANFIAGAYSNVGEYSRAVPLYRAAASYATDPQDAVTALRGAASAEANLGEAAPAEADLQDAVRRSAQLSGETRTRDQLVTRRFYVNIDIELSRCSSARVAFQRYLEANATVAPKLATRQER
jgi:tetratricopeptide (TPR) repeat protein